MRRRMRFSGAMGLPVLGLLVACAGVDSNVLNRAEAHRQLAVMKLQQNETELAIREYRSALAFHEADSETHFGISEAYRRKGLFDLARDHLRRTLELTPGNLEARLNLGVVYLQQERWDDAIGENDRLLAMPTFLRPERALVNRGWAHYKAGRAEQAELDFRAALAAGPYNQWAHLNLGIVLYERGEIVEAVAEFEEVLEILGSRTSGTISSLQTQARFRLGRAHVKLGNRTKAVEQLERAAKEGGYGEWARKSKEYLKLMQ